MRAVRHNRSSGGGSSIMNHNNPNPHKMQQKLEALEARLSHQENRTFRVAILATVVAGLTAILMVAHIHVS